MPAQHSDRYTALKRAALAALIEAADTLSTPAGPVFAGLGTLVRELRAAKQALPQEVQDALSDLRRDYERLLRAEGSRASLPLALDAALGILAHHGLGPEELAALSLDPYRAARQTLRDGTAYPRDLDEATEELVRRLVREHYRLLLTHQRALELVGVAALAALLERTAALQDSLLRLLEADRVRARRHVRWPRPTYDPGWGLQPVMIRPEYRLVREYVGRAHRESRDELLTWLRGLADRPVGQRVAVRLYVDPGGAGKTRLLLEVGEVLRDQGWSVGFLALDGGTPENASLLVDVPGPALLAVDYAGIRFREVDALLEALTEARHRQHSFALVLLDRSVPDWFRIAVQREADPGYTGRSELPLLRGVELTPHESGWKNRGTSKNAATCRGVCCLGCT